MKKKFTATQNLSSTKFGSSIRRSPSFYSLRGLEKLTYILGIPCIMLYGGYSIYRKNVSELDERA